MNGTTRQDLHHVVIVGGGAGGLELATRLGDGPARKGKLRVTLIERSRTHLWKPLLHEVAAGSMDVARHELDYLAHSHWHGYRFLFGRMIDLDRAARSVFLDATHDEEGHEITPRRSVSYDTLVIAIGSTTNDFGTPGVAEHAIALDTQEQASRFNRRVVNACYRAHAQPDPIRPGQLHVAIIGAGATGAELAAELHRTTRAVISYGLDRIDPEKDLRITLVEAAPRILPALPERVAKAAAELLSGLGVDLRTSAKVTGVTQNGVELADGSFIESELVVWAAGVRGPEVLKHLDGLETTRSGQLVVEPTLRTTRDPDIYAMGDCAACPLGGGRDGIVPPRAQAAHQEALFLTRQIQRKVAGKPPEAFSYRDFGSLVSLGHSSAVGTLMGFLSGGSLFVEGFLARMMYRSLQKRHEMALHGVIKVALDTLSRSITRTTEPHVKLH